MQKENKENIKFSIITVCLNSVRTIEQSILSVLEQTYKNIEYIIVDGQSVDGTLDIIKKYKEQIAVCVSEPDGGLYDAMNKGIRMATGDIVGILNSDDRYDIRTVEKVAQLFQEEHVDVVYGDEMLIYENGYTQRRVTGALEEITYRMNISHPTVFVKRSIYEKYGSFDTRYKIAADYDFLLRIYNQGVVMRECSGILAYFRMDGFSAQNGILCADEARNVALRHLKEEKREQYVPLIEEEHVHRIRRFQGQANMREALENTDIECCKAYLSEVYGKERKKYIIGAGIIGREVYEFALGLGIEITGFLDNNENKSGTEYLGKVVYKPLEIKDKNPLIIVAVLYGQEKIKSQLCSEGYEEGRHFIQYMDFVNDIKKCTLKV